MYNWDYPKKNNNDVIWQLERALTYGLNGQKLDKELVIKHFDKLRIPANTRTFLEMLLWNKPF